jgi:hypothetical protein
MKCEICGEETKTAFTPDLDIDGLGFCEKHQAVMRTAYYILIYVGIKDYNRFIKDKRKALAPPPKK